MDYLQKVVIDFETQSVEGIRECFDNGVDPNGYYKNKPLIYELISEYPRQPKFKECVRVFVDYGLEFEDQLLLSVLLDDADLLKSQLSANPKGIEKRYTLDCAFTPLFDADLLHICAEYNHLSCAEVLLDLGVNLNVPAGVDEHGFGGQSPIFHTVNQNENLCMDVMNLLLSKGADLTLTVKGLVWGKGNQWETFIPAVNPISYAMMGLLRQFQRKEAQIYQVVSILLKAAYGIGYFPPNVPNAYLQS